MVLAVLAALLQVPAGAPAAQPVRLTVDPSTVAPGEPVHVFVDVATAGHLLVLRVASDGRIEVVFPATPSEGTFVGAGSYEIQPSGRTTAFVANEHAGGGVVLAALALVPFELDEFVRDSTWDARALASGAGSDGTGRLLDIVQRMLGPEYFHYDVVEYTVAPYTTNESEVIGAAYGAFVPCYGYGCYGFVPALPPLPCLYSSVGCGNSPMICDPFTGLWDCGPTGPFCIDARLGCRSHTAVARYRRGEPLASAPAPTPTRPGYGRYTTLGAAGSPKGAGAAPAPYTGASRAVPLSRGTPKTSTATTTRTPRGARTDVRMPERVPWPGQVLSRGTKTAAPAVSPRHAALKQSASRPAVPQRVPWPAATSARGAKPAGASASAAGLTPVAPGERASLPIADYPKARSAVPSSAIPTARAPAAAPAGRAWTGSSRAAASAAPSRAAAPASGASSRSSGSSAKGAAAASSGGGRAASPAATGRAGKF